ncbi:MAG TPA: hypothetical protein VFO16_16480 [Pseudonocardiaceae bacterium]|nr:hypothetical protein [Pseudonocardiaceae bacterium]
MRRRAESTLRELDARDRARGRALATFVDCFCAGPEPDFDEIHTIRHADRRP